ncbi:cytochrome P450 3A27-like [Acipenser ruthenus]|uniref:cytochrome P450 3A27-like n=1 Tax=Acipenser ruthenus TaxID=7906 RepID=UPI00145BA0AF|nr:cytochrome P450 3A27-like [Acipenser ruthenus]
MTFLPTFSTATWTLFALFFTLLFVYGIWPHRLFKKLGIPGPRPLPFIGTFLEYRKGIHGFDMGCFKKYGRMWGIYDGRLPILAVMDTAMIKTILVKECYSLFTNRRNLGLNGELYDALSIVEDEAWKRIRSVLSPSFTSGRLKEIFPIVKQYADTLLRNVQKKADAKETVQMKEMFGAYSMDVVTSTSFSVNIDSLNNPKDPFVTNIKKMMKFTLFNPFLLILILFPFLLPLLKKLNVAFIPTSIMDFFYASFRKIKSDRKKNDHTAGSRVDFLQLMVDSQIPDNSAQSETDEQPSKGLTDHEILSQAMLFVFAGYETTSTTLSFLIYNLATNPKAMTKLQEEIDRVLPDKAPVTYESLAAMEYLDMALNESLRLYPAAPRLERVSKKTVEICGVTIPKGTVVMIPTYALHRDTKHWPDPEVFEPERFSKDKTESMDQYAYLPFGAGPRNCIGMRFALILVKVAMVNLLQNLSFLPCKETQIPPELDIQGLLQTKKPIELKVISRAPTNNEE